MSDLSDCFGGGMSYSFYELSNIRREMNKLDGIRKFTIGKILVDMYKNEVDESRRESFPMEDWIAVKYNHCS